MGLKLCGPCAEAVRGWQANLPRLACQWPGPAAGSLLDSRTSPAERVAEWDRRNAEMIATIRAMCARQHQGQEGPLTKCTECDWARPWAGALDDIRRCPRCSGRLVKEEPSKRPSSAT